MANQLQATELDFDKIRSNLKKYLESQDKFNDYNFEGSGLSVFLDILAYNTHYNALNSHFTINEAFLDSAQIRGNVVGHAKLLSYLPRSANAASTKVNLHIANPIGDPSPSALTLTRGSGLSAIIDGEDRPFVVEDSATVTRSPDGTFTFNNVVIKQGIYRKIVDRVDTSISNQRFVIPENNIDIGTLRVRVREHADSESYAIFTRFSSFIDITSESNVYFIQENNSGQYEIYFGDGITGVKPQSNNIVEMDYIYTEGELGNGASSYAFTGEIEGNTAVTTTVSVVGERSSGGSYREEMDSIRFNAPLTFITQNRAVTADDYKSIITKEYGDIEAISTWGGENSDPPDYGKVYISIKPKSGAALTDTAKKDVADIVKGKNVVSISPVFVDPEYTKLSLDVFFKYNPNLTDRTTAELEALVRQKISDYNTQELKRFDGVFRFSQILKQIDSADPGILNSVIRVYMFKTVTPDPTVDNNFTLNFSAQTYEADSDEQTLSSNSFLINGEPHYFADKPIANSTQRQVYIYKLVENQKVTVIGDAGYMDPANGKVEIYGFRPDTNDDIRLTVIPDSYDIAPKRNQLIEIELLSVVVTGEIDTIATAGSAGAINYTTTARHK
jgi:hypothetical protein